jgi:hypothetical protein
MKIIEVSCPECGHLNRVDKSEVRDYEAGLIQLWCSGCDDVFGSAEW